MAPFQFLEIQFPFGATSIPCQSTPGRLNIHINQFRQPGRSQSNLLRYYVASERACWLLDLAHIIWICLISGCPLSQHLIKQRCSGEVFPHLCKNGQFIQPAVTLQQVVNRCMHLPLKLMAQTINIQSKCSLFNYAIFCTQGYSAGVLARCSGSF